MCLIVCCGDECLVLSLVTAQLVSSDSIGDTDSTDLSIRERFTFVDFSSTFDHFLSHDIVRGD